MSLERALLPICGISVPAMLLFVAITMEIFTGNAHKSVSQSTLVRLGCNYSSANGLGKSWQSISLMAATGITLAHTPHMRKGGTGKCNLKICSYLVPQKFLEILAKKMIIIVISECECESAIILAITSIHEHINSYLCVCECVCVCVSPHRRLARDQVSSSGSSGCLAKE